MDLTFSSTYNESSLFLMEVPPSILDYIKTSNDELLIKGKTEPTILCTNDKNYELKLLETSNTFLVVDSSTKEESQKEIKLMTYHTIECCEISTKTYKIYNLLRQQCSLNYDYKTKTNNFSTFINKYTYDDLFAMSDLPRTSFNNLIKTQHIFEYCNGYMCLFSQSFILEIVCEWLKVLAYINKDYYIDIDEIYSLTQANDNTSKFTQIISNMNINEKRNLLEYICDIEKDETGVEVITLDRTKAKIFICKHLFYSDWKSSEEFIWSDYINFMKKALMLYLPVNIMTKDSEENETYLIESDCYDNWYEYYKEYDLRFLNGYCMIYFKKGAKLPFIRWIERCEWEENFEGRIVQWFNIKDRWTQKEIKTFMSDLNWANWSDRLTRWTQTISEKNGFDYSKEIRFWYLKKIQIISTSKQKIKGNTI